jgi:integrase
MTETPKQFLADDIVRNLPKPTKGAAKIYRDADVPGAPGTGVTGYGCRVTKAGFRALVLEYRDRETGDQKTYTIGRWPTMKVERGREIARKLRAKIEEGVDPQGEKIAKRAEPTVDELADRFEAEHLPMKKPSTAENYGRLLRLYIRPQLGSMRVSAVTLADVERMCRAVAEAGGPYQANRVQAVASKLFTSAIRWGLRSPADGNPCKFVERHKEHHRRRYAITDELQRLMAALAEHPDRQSADAIRLLLLTGARRGEVLSMRWADLALDDASPKVESEGRRSQARTRSFDAVEPAGRRPAARYPRRAEGYRPTPAAARRVCFPIGDQQDQTSRCDQAIVAQRRQSR